MLDLRFVKDNGEQLKIALARRGIAIDLSEFLALDTQRREAQSN